MEAWAPRQIAWERDNVGLQVGSHSDRVRRILITLDVTEEVVAEANRINADLIISHHPLLFHPLKTATEDHRTGRLLLRLARNHIALFVAHTNLDYIFSGVSYALATRLGLGDLRILAPVGGQLRKLVVFVPKDSTEQVFAAMAASGAGHIGNYDHCAFHLDGEGSFRPLAGTRPYIGSEGSIERVDERRIEMIVPSWRVSGVVNAMKRAHPYEEVAYDVYPLENVHPQVGAGMVGTLARPMSHTQFLTHVARALGTANLRSTRNMRRRITSVAVCGGSGSEYLSDAIAAGADAYVTADVKYHTFQDAEGRVTLVDAGHYETELPVVRHIAGRLKSEMTGGASRPDIRISRTLHNPVTYHCS